jgi:hypothetical protein
MMTTPQNPRDPGGVNSAGLKLVAGADPIGESPKFGSEVRMLDAADMPPTPIRSNTSGPEMIAFLVSNPPPPPPTPPPTKKKNRKGKTPRSSTPSGSANVQAPAPLPPPKAEEIPSSLKVTPPRLSISPGGMVNVTVQERLRNAKAMYQSEEPVLENVDPPTGNAQKGRLSTFATPTAVAGQENESPFQSRKEIVSPMSAATEPTSNQQPAAPLSPKLGNDADGPEGSAKRSKLGTPRASGNTHYVDVQEGSRRTTKLRSKTPERLRRGRNNKTKNKGGRSLGSLTSGSGQEKKGFFRKLFKGKRSKSSNNAMEGMEGGTIISDKTSSKEAKSAGPSDGEHQFHSDFAQSSSGEIVDTPGVDEDRPELFYAQDEVSTLTAPTIESTRGRRWGDPSVSDHSSDPMGRYWDSDASDPLAEKPVTPTIDPFREPFFEPEGLSPGKIFKRPELKVNVPDGHDPAGDSPFNKQGKIVAKTAGRPSIEPSPRGYQTPSFMEHPIQDPLGESPLHKMDRGPSELRDGSPFAPDPPLYMRSNDGSGISEDRNDMVSEDTLSSVEEPPKLEDSIKSISKPPPPPPDRHLHVRVPRSPARNSDWLVTETTSSSARPGMAICTSLAPNSPTSQQSTSTTSVSSGSSEEVQDQEDSITKESAETKNSRKRFSMSAAARMNAKAVAYIHTLNGEPSPRSKWHKPQESDEDATPKAGTRQGKLKTRLHPASTSKYSYAKLINAEHEQEQGSLGNGGEGVKLFSAYSGKFKGRKPASSVKEPIAPLEASTDFAAVLRRSHPPVYRHEGPLDRDISVASTAFTRGIDMKRQKWENDIATGRAFRVIPEPKVQVPVVESCFGPMEEVEPKDPIQRAGRRLLTKAAIPIQTAARRFLAQREAIDRMWALLEIQSYMRRWRTEVSFVACKHSARLIQSAYRGAAVRRALRVRTDAAIVIQKIVRGYLAAANVYDFVYKIITVQSRVRGFLTRFRIRKYAATKLQAWWRERSIRMQYQFLVVDTIISQTIVRRWLARRKLDALRKEKHDSAATKIQATWRGFQGYTDYIFCLVDIMLLQRSARSWLAQKKVKELKMERSAVMIQKHWRAYRAYAKYVFALADILRVQCMMRSWFARREAQSRRIELSAVKIQRQWRRFTVYTNYMFVLVNVMQVQRFVRGWFGRKKARTWLMDQAATIIQKEWRCYRARMQVLHDLVNIIMVQVSRFLKC